MRHKELTKTWSRRAIILSGIFVFAACGGGGSSDTPETSAKPAEKAAAPAKQVQPASATLAGQIIFEGTAPANATIKMDSDPVCKNQHAGAVKTEEYIVGAGGELANVFVYVKSGLGAQKFPTPTDTVIFDQKGCEYYPHIFGMQVKQPLAIVNSDPTLHNVHPLPANSRGFNIGMPKQGMRITKTFDQPEVMVRIKCDVHAWMNAWIGVLDHPYFAVTDKNGKFSIGPLPPGEYVLEAWHEKLGTQTQTITVNANETKDAPFKFAQSAS